MASISTEKADGRIIGRRIQFVAKDGKRKTVRLGKVSLHLAEKIKVQIEALNRAACNGMSPELESTKWVNSPSAVMQDRLAAVGLIPERTPREDLGKFLESYIAGRTDIKPRTRINLKACQSKLIDFFGADKPLDAITAGDADEFLINLQDRYAAGTAGRCVRHAKQFFRAAVRKKLLAENPFADVKAPSQINEARKFFVSREMAAAVLDRCPDAEWRLLFALSRYGGLRCPPEHFGLLWADVDWERGRFLVRSPKTEHHEGGANRWVPIFPELRPYLEDCFDPESTYVINHYRHRNQNLRTRLRRIIRKAGLEPWPKLFHNLRASRETELVEEYPIHVVCKWIGNTALIAAKHYLQVTEDHFKRATSAGAESGATAVQNPTQQPTAERRIVSQESSEEKESCEVMRDSAASCKPFAVKERLHSGGRLDYCLV
jgi:site-specific recombinase XerD